MGITQAVDKRGSEPVDARRRRTHRAMLVAGVIALAAAFAPTSANAVVANSILAPSSSSTFDLSCAGTDPVTNQILGAYSLDPFTMPTTVSSNEIDSPADGESFTLDLTWQFTLPAGFVGVAEAIGSPVIQTNSTLSITATSGATGTSAQMDPGPTTINIPVDPPVAVPFRSNPVQLTFTRSGTGIPVVLAPDSVTMTLTQAAPLNLICTPMAVTPLTLNDQAPIAPGPPTIGTASAGNGQATVSWTASFDGGSLIVGYVVVGYIGYAPVRVRIFNSPATTETVTGLTNGTQYRFRVFAYNSIGVSGYSKVTHPVTPHA
jgi:hypothetical protein